MHSNQPYCPNSDCAEVGRSNNGNVKVYSHQEQRYYCTTCGQRFRLSRDTVFYRLRTPRQDFIEAVGRLAERCSLRAIARIKDATLGTVLHWLDIAGTQAATVTPQLIGNLHLTQVQIDELGRIAFYGSKAWFEILTCDNVSLVSINLLHNTTSP